jgi:outer membrane protein
MRAILLTLFVTFTSLVSFSQGKIGHVNTQKVLDTMPSRKNAMNELAMMQTLGQRELIQKDSLIQAGLLELQKHPEWSDATKNYQKQRLQRMDQELQYRQQELDQQLQMYSQEMNMKVTERAKAAVATISKAKGLAYVLDENSILFNSGGTDITKEVVTEVLRLEALGK